ncbi:MAG: hypothetical protein ACKVPX_01525 [Myxococcaceae bacterium]
MRFFRVWVVGVVGGMLLLAAGCPNDTTCDNTLNACAGGQICHEGACVDCVTDTDCTGDAACAALTCDLETHACASFPSSNPPADDGNPCTVEACPSNTFASAGTPCAFAGGLSCDASGNCIAPSCNNDADCGADTYCGDMSCNLMTNRCQRAPLNEGNVVPGDAPNDCVENVCVAGLVTPRNDNTEVPPQDSNVCTTETCSNGSVASAPGNVGGVCSGGFCSSTGTCGPVTLLSENFDGLPTGGTSTFAIFKAALTSGAWQLASDDTTPRAGGGTGSTGAIWSFGTVGTTDRALGGYATPSTGTQAWGVCMTNSASAAVNTVTVTYTGEQWRDGSSDAQSLTFSFSTFYAGSTLEAGLRATGTGNHTTGWESVTALSFTSPQLTTAAAALNGNAPANRTAISAAIPGLTLAAGATLCVRWIDLDDAGADHGLAIDDLLVQGL